MPSEDSSPKDEAIAKLTADIKKEKDTFLISLARGTRNSPGLHITLMVKGLLVSGTIITPGDYLRSFGGPEPETAESDQSVRTFFHDMADEADQEYSKADEDEQTRLSLAQEYIHLKDARVFVPGQIPWPTSDQRGVYWRVRFRSIDGFVPDSPAWPGDEL